MEKEVGGQEGGKESGIEEMGGREWEEGQGLGGGRGTHRRKTGEHANHTNSPLLPTHVEGKVQGLEKW